MLATAEQAIARLVRDPVRADLCATFLESDQLAMRALFGRHRVPLYRWLLRLVGDESSAEDLLSDVFLDVWRQAAAFEARSSVSTWLLAIARYKALSGRPRQRLSGCTVAS